LAFNSSRVPARTNFEVALSIAASSDRDPPQRHSAKAAIGCQSSFRLSSRPK
jgi:hypothetical protein